MIARAAGLLAGYALDRALGDPRRWHPVAGFGRVAGTVEGRLYADSVSRGSMHVAVLVGGAIALGTAAERRGPFVGTMFATWAVLGGRSLDHEASVIGERLSDGDLPGARRRLTHLVGRDPSGLTEDEVARAVVESVAENTSDAVVAPLFWGAVAGVPGLLGYRAINTLDAMVGHRNARYERFGKPAARVDDIANLIPARLAAALAMAAGPDRHGAGRAWREDAAGHPSPNAGPVESAFAGALGIRLGGTNVYGERIEHRPVMGDGRPVTPADIGPARRLAARVGHGAALTAAAIALLRHPSTGAVRRRPSDG
ncbi:cobalamin biosynthesis protein [Aeromicrobium sp. PE09-221]|uniref:cobalamin biosynthesis protein n=1 Tax=Aeromicrobium sp. PE09-221 TaxID=1898043 RepID=UPI000B3E42B7|nr:cobalamin biosynthesis protein [Aeromicrobium sp. PE09-221]OUZ07591.1 cobalamin biosynthesis protein [Aeromicrobium sp. PE09-221]